MIGPWLILFAAFGHDRSESRFFYSLSDHVKYVRRRWPFAFSDPVRILGTINCLDW